VWPLLITLYALVLLALIAATGYVGIFTADRHRGDRAIKILKLLLFAALSTTGLFALAIQVHDAGLM